MLEKNSIPLGYIELESGTKPVYPMNDIFLNYTFQKKEYWETLRIAVNLIIEEYRRQFPDASIEQITGNIEVRTEFQHLLNLQNTTRDQDIRILKNKDDVTETTYIEFQNRRNTDPPIKVRSVHP